MATPPGPRSTTSGSRLPRHAGSRRHSPADRFMGVCHSPGHMQQPVKHYSPCSASGGRAVSQALTYETGLTRRKTGSLVDGPWNLPADGHQAARRRPAQSRNVLRAELRRLLIRYGRQSAGRHLCPCGVPYWAPRENLHRAGLTGRLWLGTASQPQRSRKWFRTRDWLGEMEITTRSVCWQDGR